MFLAMSHRSWVWQRHGHPPFRPLSIDHGKFGTRLFISFWNRTTTMSRPCGRNASRKSMDGRSAFCGGRVFGGGPATSHSFAAAPTRTIIDNVVWRYLDCGVEEAGVVRISCRDCGRERLLTLSCKSYYTSREQAEGCLFLTAVRASGSSYM
jgi:hypothetical protein